MWRSVSLLKKATAQVINLMVLGTSSQAEPNKFTFFHPLEQQHPG